MPDIDIGAISEALNDKTDRDMRNVDNTAGADAVIEYQAPTAGNNYTWYRKYKSGWVEQGGILTGRLGTITLSVEMADTNYCITFTGCFTTNPTSSSAEINPYAKDITTTSIYLYTNRADKLTRRVEGMAA